MPGLTFDARVADNRQVSGGFRSGILLFEVSDGIGGRRRILRGITLGTQNATAAAGIRRKEAANSVGTMRRIPDLIFTLYAPSPKAAAI